MRPATLKTTQRNDPSAVWTLEAKRQVDYLLEAIQHFLLLERSSRVGDIVWRWRAYLWKICVLRHQSNGEWG
jgi:hypothetical protein